MRARARIAIAIAIATALVCAGSNLKSALAATPPPDQLAIAALAMNPNYAALGPRHIAAGMGLPMFLTHDPSVAMRQPMIIIAGELGADKMNSELVARMRAYARAGGTIVIDDPESIGAQDLAAIKPTVTSQQRYRLHFDTSSGDPGFAHLRAWQSQTIVIGNPVLRQADVTQSLAPAGRDGARIIAHFDDGSGAVSVHPIGLGRVYAIGASLFDLVVVPQSNHDPDAQRWYDNHFEPSADAPQFLIRDWYLAYVRGAIALDPAPDGKSGSLIFTHDIDYSLSIVNMVAYARAEHARGFSSTFFVQTKNVHDQADLAFFDAAGKKNTVTVASLGGDIGSHSVAHARDYMQFDWGTGTEKPENYHPKVVAGGRLVVHGKTIGATLLGELAVSKAMLEATVPGATVDAYRSGYLYIHPRQFEALAHTGYRFDSSYTAGDLMTAFPFVEMANDSFSRESAITEFPILITDSKEPMLPLVPDFERVLDDEAVLHCVCVVLIHPDVVADKLPTELALYDYAKRRFWVGSIDAFGDFWLSRGHVSIETSINGDTETLRVTSPNGLRGLTLDSGYAVRIAEAHGTTATAAAGGRDIVLDALTPGQTAVIVLELLKQAGRT